MARGCRRLVARRADPGLVEYTGYAQMCSRREEDETGGGAL